MNRRRYFTTLILLTFITTLTAQTIDSVLMPSDKDLEKVVNLRQQFEKQNKSYSVATSYIRDHSPKSIDTRPLRMSDEALYWISWKQSPDKVFKHYVSYQDTIIVNPLFIMPNLYQGNYLPTDLKLYDPSALSKPTAYDKLSQPVTLFPELKRQVKIEDDAYRYVKAHHPNYFKYTVESFPNDIIKTHYIKKDKPTGPVLEAKNDATPIEEVDAPVKFIPDIKYWTSSLESTMQFAQNYISSNWHNGGNSNLNMTTRQYLQYNYKKDNVTLTNEFEFRLNMNTLPESADTMHSYKINDDVIRLHSNLGLRAWRNWYYTFDFLFKTQLAKNFQTNTNNIQASFLAPLQVTIGPGMKYDLSKTFPKNKHKSLKLSVNMAPIAYDFLYSRLYDDKMNLARHGFQLRTDSVLSGENAYKHIHHQVGTKIETNLTFNFNRYTSWTSRFYYFTNYQRIIGEFENTFNFQINRFFSTRINIQFRYDDGITKGEDFKSYFQTNELLSFGFNYKW